MIDAALDNDLIKLKELLELDTNINAKDFYGKTVLMVASIKGHIAIVEHLLSVPEIDINIKDNNAYTALMHAESKGNFFIANRLRPLTNISFTKQEQVKAFLYSAKCGHSIIMQQLLSFSKLDINIKFRDDKTALMISAEEGHDNIVKILLGVPYIDINATSFFQKSALMYAVDKGHEKVVKSLVSVNTIDVNARDMSQSTSLMIAAEKGHNKILSLLLLCPNIDLSCMDYFSHTVLTKAAARDNIVALKLLFTYLEHKNINIDSFLNIAFYKLATEKSLKYLIYSGVNQIIDEILDNCSSNILFKNFLSEIKNKKEMLSKLTAHGYFSILDLQESESSCLDCIVPYFPKIFARRVVPMLPSRLDLLEARVLGYNLEDDVVLTYTKMSIKKFRAVSNLMRYAVLSKLSHGFNLYIFSYILMFGFVTGSKFAKWPFEIRSYFLDFILGSGFFISRKDFELSSNFNISNKSENRMHNYLIYNKVTPYNDLDYIGNK